MSGAAAATNGRGVPGVTSVTCYDGVGCIGGNKILLESRGTALFLDFGVAFSAKERYYQEFLQPRAVKGLLDPLMMGLLPPLRGIYRQDLVPDSSMWPTIERLTPARELDIDGVLLSHAHLDHSGYVSFLEPGTPVVCSPMTALITKATQDGGRSTMESEVCYAVPKLCENGVIGALSKADAVQRPFLLVGSPGELSEAAERLWTGTFRKTRSLQPVPLRECRQIGALQVCGYPVDHSIYGATAYAIETGDGWIVYTGDLRLHGARSEQTRAFAEAAAALQPLALITEGTHVGKESTATEDAVFENTLAAVRRASGRLVIADFGPRNVERLLSFLRVAEQTGRRLLLTAKDVLLLEYMHAVDPSVPDPSADPRMALYEKPQARTDGWNEHVIELMAGKVVPPEEVAADPGGSVLCFGFFDLSHLVDINPPPGGLYIYSSSELYTEEQQFDFGRLRNWLARFGLQLVGDPEDKESEAQYHASGHITGPALEELIRIIRPRHLIPVHTLAPHWFEEKFSREMTVLNPERGAPIPLSA